MSRVGQQLGNYSLLRLLGTGGFAEVYLGEHRHLGTQVAIKILHDRMTGNEADNFRREARTIAHLVHPSIVRVLDFQVDEEFSYLIMEYAPHGTLRRRHPRGERLALPVVVNYTTQMANALQYAHDQHVVHRDVKPENMLLGRSQEVLLSDFGIATLSQNSRSMTIEEVAGTASYMAPEQMQGKARPASDQYALAAVVYEWLAGTVPFRGTFIEIASQKLTKGVPPLREKVPDLSPDVEQVIMIALSLDPAHRFGNIAAFALALKQAWQANSEQTMFVANPSSNPGFVSLPGGPISYDAPTLNEEKYSNNNRTPVFDATIDAAKSPLRLQPVTPLPETNIPHFASNTSANYSQPNPLNQVNQLGQPGQISQPSQSPRRVSRRTVVASVATGIIAVGAVGSGVFWWSTHEGSSKQNGTPTPVVHATATAASLALGTLVLTYKKHKQYLYAVRWSPDGTKVASAGDDKTVQVWDAKTGDTITTYSGHKSYVYGLSWSPTGQLLVSSGADNTAQIWNAENGQQLQVHNESNWIPCVDWSPSVNNPRILTSSNNKTVEVLDANSAQTKLTYMETQAVQTGVWSPDAKYFASGGGGNVVHIWDASTASSTPLSSYTGHTKQIRSAAWSPDGKYIASSSYDQTVHVWEAFTGKQVYIYKGHSYYVNDAAWSPDGKRIASASSDNTVQIWDALTGNNPYTYRGHPLYVESARWSPNGQFIASCSYDKTVQVWAAR